MKNKITNILLIGLILVLIFAVTKDYVFDLNLSTQKENIVTITGKAEKDVAPDTARITFSINEYKKTQKEAANIVNQKTKDIVDALEELDIDKKDIKTKNYSVYPQYNWNDGKRTFQNYKVSQSVEVKIRNLDIVSKALAKIVELKVDNLSGPNMFIDKLDDIKDSLRGEAIENAKEKAKELASELGVDLDKIVGFSEGGNDNYYPPTLYRGVDMMAMNSAKDEVIEPEINPGEEKITKTVSITFQIED